MPILLLFALIPFGLLYGFARVRHEPTPGKTALIAAALLALANSVFGPLLNTAFYAFPLIDSGLLGQSILWCVVLTIVFRRVFTTIPTTRMAFLFAVGFSFVGAALVFALFAVAMSGWGGPL